MRRAATRRRTVARRAAVVAGVLLLAAAVGFVGTTTLFSSAGVADVEWLSLNQVTAVTIDVESGEGSVRVAVDNMAPGDRASGRLDVVNGGTAAFRYALVGESSNPAVAAHLRVDLWPGDEDCAAAPSGLLAADRPGIGRILGDPATGLQPGDRVVEVDGSDRLCFAVVLDRAAPNTVQGETVSQTFVVLAEHDVEPA